MPLSDCARWAQSDPVLPRFISLTVALIALVALISSGAFVMARWYEMDTLVQITLVSLKWSLYIVAACCGYAILVGIYHTILSVTGLDEERDEGASS